MIVPSLLKTPSAWASIACAADSRPDTERPYHLSLAREAGSRRPTGPLASSRATSCLAMPGEHGGWTKRSSGSTWPGRIRVAFARRCNRCWARRHLSKSAISRVVAWLKEHFQRWQERDLSEERYPILYLDGLHLKVRLARRVVSGPVLAVLGVAPDGQKQLVALRLAVSEASACWASVIASLQRRNLSDPLLLVADGHAGLRKALENWSSVKLQRCTVHKLENLLDHCPVHARPEMKRDYHAIVRAKDGISAREAYDAFLSKWRMLYPSVAASLEEAGLDLLTFYEFPKAMWKGLRSTNSIENLNREFRRRTKTQGSFSTEAAALTMLYGLVAFGQIELRRITGCKTMKGLLQEGWTTAA